MDADEKIRILNHYKDWFREVLMVAHKKNTKKLIDIKEFNINPFTVFYLAKFFRNDTSPRSVAEVLLLPRMLGTSISTSFGQNIQRFISLTLGGYGSLRAGLDIEFVDQIDGRMKYCQLKSGPNSLNNPDVTTIFNDFQGIRNLARTNNLALQYGDLVFALLYGERGELNSFIRLLESRDITVLVGKEFWHHFTGDEDFYESLFAASAQVAREANLEPIIENVLDRLAAEVAILYKDYYDQNLDKEVDR